MVKKFYIFFTPSYEQNSAEYTGDIAQFSKRSKIF